MRRHRDHATVAFGSQPPVDAFGPDGRGEDHPRRSLPARPAKRSDRRDSRRDPVVDHDGRGTGDGGRWRPLAVGSDAPRDLVFLATGFGLDVGVVDAHDEHAAPIDHAHSGRDRADPELGIAGSAELAGDHDVERGSQRPRDLACHHDPAPGHAEHDHGWVDDADQRASELSTGVDAVLEHTIARHEEEDARCAVHSSTASIGASHDETEGAPVVHAYILIQTEVGKAASVAEAVRTIDGVAEAEDVTGPYDVIVRAEAKTVDELGKLVVARIQSVEGITRTLTCPVVHL